MPLCVCSIFTFAFACNCHWHFVCKFITAQIDNVTHTPHTHPLFFPLNTSAFALFYILPCVVSFVFYAAKFNLFIYYLFDLKENANNYSECWLRGIKLCITLLMVNGHSRLFISGICSL